MQRLPLFGLLLLCPLFTVLAQTEASSVSQNSWLDGGAQNNFEESPLLQFPETREADIMWEKRVWRIVDSREKMNLPFRNENLPLYRIIEEGIREGAITPYSTEDDRFGTPLDGIATLDAYNTKDTIDVYDFVTNYDETKVVVNELNPDDIKRWRIQEVWYFDSRYSTLKVRIIGIAPLLESRKEDDSVRFESPMFWINYAEARNWLAQYPVPVIGNDRAEMSWEDHFEMRRFHGYVYQEEDLLGRRLVDYTSGRDLLIKSDQIDQSIQHYEHDLWEY